MLHKGHIIGKELRFSNGVDETRRAAFIEGVQGLTDAKNTGLAPRFQVRTPTEHRPTNERGPMPPFRDS